MATVDRPNRDFSFGVVRQRVLDPLNKLRGLIRYYVTVEGVLSALLFMAAVFWMGLLLDYGVFRLRGWDWVQQFPWVVRAIVLAVLVAALIGLLVLRVGFRLFVEFRDAALALLLERRFPRKLGDRLITAVELADTKRAEARGYSVPMVEKTIAEASELVGQVPFRQVFNWTRLRVMWAFVGVVTVITYLAVGTTWCVWDSVRDRQATLAGFSELNEVSLTWFERNILLQNVIWPRRSFLVVVDYPAPGQYGDTVTLGQDAPPPTVHVIALKYVLADGRTKEGWRPMTLEDIQGKKYGLIKGDAPSMEALPTTWKPRQLLNRLYDEKTVGAVTARMGLQQPPVWAVDDLDMNLRRFEVRKTGDGKWELADAGSPGGWRSLTWGDLSRVQDELGMKELPALPTQWVTEGSTPEKVPMDTVLARMGDAEGGMSQEARADIQNIVVAHLEKVSGVQKLLTDLDEQLGKSSFKRVARKLIVPNKVVVRYDGLTTSSNLPLTPLPNGEYSGQLSDLKDAGQLPWKFTLWVYGEDYVTPAKYINVVPRPALTSLKTVEARPAYLYYRIGEGVEVADLAGKKQLFAARDASLQGGETSKVDVPAGTDVTLVGKVDKPIKFIKVRNRKDRAEVKADISFPGNPEYTKYHNEGMKGDFNGKHPEEFEATFKDVRQTVDVVFEFTDTDDVIGSRKVEIKPTPDLEPAVALQISDIVRKVKGDYMVTAKARIPFQSGEAKDDNGGLVSVRFGYTIQPHDSLQLAAKEADTRILASAIPLFAPGSVTPTSGSALLHLMAHEAQKNIDAEAKRPEFRIPVEKFERTIRNRPDEFLPPTRVKELLGQPQSLPYRQMLKVFKIEPDSWKNPQTDPLDCDFPVWKVLYEGKPILVTSETGVQPRYKMTLWLEAEDNDLDSDKDREGKPRPHVGKPADKLSIVVVSETELLVEIGNSEEKIHDEFETGYNQVVEAQLKLGNVRQDLSGGRPEYVALSARAEDLDQTLDKSQVVAQETLAKYQAILRELKFNQINPKRVREVEVNIVQQLEEALKIDYDDARKKVAALRAALDGSEPKLGPSRKAADEATQSLKELLAKLSKIRDSMAKQKDLNAVIRLLREIEKAEQEQAEIIKAMKDKILRDILEGATDPTKP